MDHYYGNFRVMTKTKLKSWFQVIDLCAVHYAINSFLYFVLNIDMTFSHNFFPFAGEYVDSTTTAFEFKQL